MSTAKTVGALLLGIGVGLMVHEVISRHNVSAPVEVEHVDQGDAVDVSAFTVAGSVRPAPFEIYHEPGTQSDVAEDRMIARALRSARRVVKRGTARRGGHRLAAYALLFLVWLMGQTHTRVTSWVDLAEQVRDRVVSILIRVDAAADAAWLQARSTALRCHPTRGPDAAFTPGPFTVSAGCVM